MAGAGSPDDLWQRLSGVRLRLRDTVSVHALEYRGRAWYLLRDALSSQQFRLNGAVYAVLAELDGRRTLAQAWQRHVGQSEGSGGNKTDLLNALLQLQAAGMLDAGPTMDAAALVGRQRRQRRQQGLARWLRLLSPRLPLVEPDHFLTRSLPLVGWVFHPWALWMWLLLALGAGLQALMHWPALALYGAQRLDDPRSWLLLVAVYPLVKALHEIGHGLAAKRAGAEVNEMGITLLVFVPVPYVDASAASALRDKSQRMLVGAAGILVEGVLAALAMFAWLALDDGLLRESMFAVMLIGGVSTLLFNGNPLLRFDGYYVLSDAIEIPNLATRAARYWGYLARRYLLGLGGERSPANATGELRWFFFYGAASTVYRLMISLGIALFLIATVPTLGVLLGGLVDRRAGAAAAGAATALSVFQRGADGTATAFAGHRRRPDVRHTRVTCVDPVPLEHQGRWRRAAARAGDRACQRRWLPRSSAGRLRQPGRRGRSAVCAEQPGVGA